MDGVQLRTLTVDFHEPGFVAQIAGENGLPFWFQMSDEQRQKAGSPWGPSNPQALNRYSYVQNSPLGGTDPTGHAVPCKEKDCRTRVDVSSLPNIVKKVIAYGCVLFGCEIDDTQSTLIGPSPENVGAELMPLGMVGERFASAGIEVSEHFLRRLVQREARGITEELALRAYNKGRLFYNPLEKSFIRYDSQTGIAVAVDRATGGKVITVFEGNVSPNWIPVRWRP